jgi:hypothetical protein
MVPPAVGDAGARGVDIFDEDKGDRGCLAETAAGRGEGEDGTVSFEFYVPDRAAVRNGEPDGLAETQNFGDPACGGCRIAS